MQFSPSPTVSLLECLRLRGDGLSSQLHLTHCRHVSSYYQSPRRGQAEPFQLVCQSYLPANTIGWIAAYIVFSFYMFISEDFILVLWQIVAEVKPQRPLVLMAIVIKRLLIDPNPIEQFQFQFLSVELQNSVSHQCVPSRSSSDSTILCANPVVNEVW